MSKTEIPLSLGEHLDKELKAYNKTEFARRIGISRKQLYNLLDDKRSLTLEVAKRLGKETGKGAKFWLDLEHEHRLYVGGLSNGPEKAGRVWGLCELQSQLLEEAKLAKSM